MLPHWYNWKEQQEYGISIFKQMKNKTISTLVFAFAWCFAQAQGETRIGIKAGYTSANVFGSDLNQLSNNGSAEPLGGFLFGVYVDSKLYKHLWLKSEVLTTQKGAVLKIKDKWNQQYNSNLKSQYIVVYPFSPTFHYKGFQLLAGPYISMLLSASVQSKDSLGNLTTNTQDFGTAPRLSHYRQKIDAGIVFGLEYQTKWGITIGGRYTYGFVPIYENADAIVIVNAPELPQQKIYNKSLSISIGYTFGKHKKEEKKETDPLLFKHQ